MEWKPGIHSVDGVRISNAYLALDAGRTLVIDTGLPGNANRILGAVRRAGRDPSGALILLTHGDMDHTGSAAELRRTAGVPIAALAAEAPGLLGERPLKHMRGAWRLLFPLLSAVMPRRTLQPDRWLMDGEIVDGWTVIAAPGHTPGSMCLHKPGEALFSGDALLCDSRGNPAPPRSAISDDWTAARASAERLAALEFDALFPGHGRPCIGGAAEKVRRMLAAWTPA